MFFTKLALAMTCDLQESLAFVRRIICSSSTFDLHRRKAVLVDAMYTESQYLCFKERGKRGKQGKRSGVGI